MRLLPTLTLAAAVLFASTGVATAAPVADKELCKSGGFASYVDPATGTPFANQGQCVSFVNGGGVLREVENRTVDLDVRPLPGGEYCLPYLTLAGFEPNSNIVGIYDNGVDEPSEFSVPTDETGGVTTHFGGLVRPGDTLTITFGGLSATDTCTPL